MASVTIHVAFKLDGDVPIEVDTETGEFLIGEPTLFPEADICGDAELIEMFNPDLKMRIEEDLAQELTDAADLAIYRRYFQ